jgi:DnaJ-class molecular chaperone
MPNYDIRVSAGKSPQPKPSNYSTWKCPFCQGTGLTPYGKTAAERCPACHGRMSWEADAAISMLSSCGRCAGTGRVNHMGNWAPCPECHGSGKV